MKEFLRVVLFVLAIVLVIGLRVHTNVFETVTFFLAAAYVVLESVGFVFE